MKMTVEKIKVLGKFIFLIVMSSHAEQHHILAETPLFIEKCMVLTLLWKVDFKIANLCSTSAPMWIDLPILNPTFKYFANDILSEVREVVYAGTKLTRS